MVIDNYINYINENNLDKEWQIDKQNIIDSLPVEESPISIPEEFICVYHKLLNYIIDFNSKIHNICSNSCSNNNFIKLWSLFQSAIANFNIGNFKLTNLFIKYVILSINKEYDGKENVNVAPEKINENGEVLQLVSCSDYNKFVIDYESGDLYSKKENYDIVKDGLYYNKDYGKEIQNVR